MGWTGLISNIFLEDILGLEIQHDAILVNPSVSEKFIKNLNGGVVQGTLPNVQGWKQNDIRFTIEFKSKEMIEFRFNLFTPMDVYILDYKTRDKIFSGDFIKIMEVEVKNNKDVLAILSKPEDNVIKDEFSKNRFITLS